MIGSFAATTPEIAPGLAEHPLVEELMAERLGIQEQFAADLVFGEGGLPGVLRTGSA